MAYNDGGYKITINEKTSKEEILNVFAKVLTYLEQTHGIDEFGKINLYLQMYKDDERQMLVNLNTFEQEEGGRILSPEKAHKTYQELPDGSKKVVFNKQLDGQRLENTVKSSIQKPFSTNCTMIPVSKMEELRRQEALRHEEIRKKKEAERHRLYLEQKEKKDKETAILNNFKTFIANKLNCDIKDLFIYTTSLGHLKDKKTILKYLAGKTMPSEEEVFRVTYKDIETKKASFIEIYSMDLELLNRID